MISKRFHFAVPWKKQTLLCALEHVLGGNTVEIHKSTAQNLNQNGIGRNQTDTKLPVYDVI